jgi:hypothetical protein
MLTLRYSRVTRDNVIPAGTAVRVVSVLPASLLYPTRLVCERDGRIFTVCA